MIDKLFIKFSDLILFLYLSVYYVCWLKLTSFAVVNVSI